MMLVERGYVIQWPTGSICRDSFASNRHACWVKALGGVPAKIVRDWKKKGLRCVPAVRTIETGNDWVNREIAEKTGVKL